MINKKAPEFYARAFYKNQIKEITLSEYLGRWIVLFFYPADFTFVCPTELRELAKNYEVFKEMGVEIFSISTDTEFAHKAWHDASESIKLIDFPMIADPTGKICRNYGTYIENEGLSLRATFIIDPDGFVKAYEMNDNSIGRSSEELIRKIKALKFTRENKGEFCPMNWQPGEKTIKPDLNLVGKI